MRLARFLTLALLSAAIAGRLRRRQRRLDLRPAPRHRRRRAAPASAEPAGLPDRRTRTWSTISALGINSSRRP